jgi:hypothetical protein
MPTQEGNAVRQMNIDPDVKEGVAAIIDLAKDPNALKTSLENEKTALETRNRRGTDEELKAAWDKVDANPIQVAIVGAITARSPEQREQMEKALNKIVEGQGLDPAEVHKLLEQIDGKDPKALRKLQDAVLNSVDGALSETPIAATELGNAIRQVNMDPKVREGLAQIVDASGKSLGNRLKAEVENEGVLIQAHKDGPEAEKAALGRINSDTRGLNPIEDTIMYAMEARPFEKKGEVEKALDKIVESQGLQPADVHKLLMKMDEQDHDAYLKLRDAVKGGIDAALGAPPQTPNGQQHVEVKER